MSEKVKAAVARMRAKADQLRLDAMSRDSRDRERLGNDAAALDILTGIAEGTLPKPPTIAQAVAFARASVDPSGHMAVLADAVETFDQYIRGRGLRAPAVRGPTVMWHDRFNDTRGTFRAEPVAEANTPRCFCPLCASP